MIAKLADTMSRREILASYLVLTYANEFLRQPLHYNEAWIREYWRLRNNDYDAVIDLLTDYTRKYKPPMHEFESESYKVVADLLATLTLTKECAIRGDMQYVENVARLIFIPHIARLRRDVFDRIVPDDVAERLIEVRPSVSELLNGADEWW